MSFHAGANNVRVEDNHILKATIPNEAGEMVEAELDLNSCIGNHNGSFQWEGQGYADSGGAFSFSFEGGGIPVLRAELKNVDGEGVPSDINIAERISNQNGRLVFDPIQWIRRC
ncbi:related to Cyanovirin-N homolog [Rhynchosporium agropyri]|uniref:Related to Cyanovirin-N homolog n=2 Tax=Rhynchosporium TaxID=38037 RepID=A0A1E1KI17_9HELO|nr:related to Cyanovirin-N homolog [Rhynchosporium agropyri]CZT11594.1 related to cyanovirin-N family protein [Rhynchosporium commune]